MNLTNDVCQESGMKLETASHRKVKEGEQKKHMQQQPEGEDEKQVENFLSLGSSPSLSLSSFSPESSSPETSSPEALSPTSLSPSSLPLAVPLPMSIPLPSQLMSQIQLPLLSQTKPKSERESQLQPEAELAPAESLSELQTPPQSHTVAFKLAKVWLFYIMMPAGVVAWIETKNVTIAIWCALFPLLVAIAQGAWGILKYRIFFSRKPHPQGPCHGVVVVDPQDKCMSSSSWGLPSYSKKDFIAERALLEKFNHQTEQPIRLLVIGDSLAIGVGQHKLATPRMPEVIARTISKALGGRVVYWTCHGEPGASAGWIVRTLEGGAQNRSQEFDDEDEDYDYEEDHVQQTSNYSKDALEKEQDFSSCPETTDTDETSSDESLEDDSYSRHRKRQQQQSTTTSHRSTYKCDEERLSRKMWKERLKQHRKRFDPDTMGPYDIVVVMSGSNDLKSACFPFLLSGEDKEIMRQSKSYDFELRRVFNTISQSTRRRLMTFRESVEHFRDSVEAVSENVMEKIHPGSSTRTQLRKRIGHANASRNLNENPNSYDHALSSEQLHSILNPSDYDCKRNQTVAEYEGDKERKDTRFPLVVLPGMPARALPVFRKFPLRWLSIPFVDIMDSIKKNLMESHPEEVLFVPPPSLQDIGQYESQKGTIWEQRCKEDTLLSMNDIHSSQIRQIQQDMADYQLANKDSKLTCGVGSSIFSVDQIHPNDEGYDFWGRYIATAIVQDWKRKQL